MTTTADEAARTAHLAREEGWQRLLLVTSPSHSARAAALFRAHLHGLEGGVEVRYGPAEEWRFDVRGETLHDRLQGLSGVAYEWLPRAKAAVV